MLARGSRGIDVIEIKRNLLLIGYNSGGDNDFFDIRTEETIMQFQHENGLPVTGIADYMTQARIFNLINKALLKRSRKISTNL